MSAFKAYDIRGVYGEEFTLDDVFRIGSYLPELLQTDKILVGRDCRSSSPAIYEALSDGLVYAGAEVHYTGLATTPMIYYLTAKYGYRGSVQITASHNPKEYNGLKISGPAAMPVGKDNGLGLLEQMIKKSPSPGHTRGKILDVDLRQEYASFLTSYIPDNQLRLAIDSSNGMAGLFLQELMGNQPDYLFLELDGTFPNHEANPLDENNLHQLKKEVLTKKSDLGVIFDGDADRVAFIDENGSAIPPDLIIAVLGHYFLEKEQGNVLVDIRTSRSVEEYLLPMGGKVHTWRVGRAYASPKLKEINGIYGGELAGHYYFRDFYYSDSGLLAFLMALKVFNRMKSLGIPVSSLINKIKKYYNSGEINFRITDKQSAIKALCDHFLKQETPQGSMDFDGYRYDFRDWWFNVRSSNTEPYLRLLIESKFEDLLKAKLHEATQILSLFQTN
ncbi:MAG: phosphomannomutase/phosphoglucomutase [Bacteroidetes bacterium]|nr:phosphomannomutase/phosphoglucomutase [Bacteroidota bacterium]